MNNIEEELWNYIDGTGTPAERAAIALLIEQDKLYRHKYEELSALNAEFASMEFEEPSMGFTYNVMEQIRTEQALKPLKATIDSRIIKGIASFFILTIMALLIYSLFLVNWSAGGIEWKVPQVNMPHISSMFSSTVVKGFLFFDAVLGLYLFDYLLRRNKTAKAA